MADARVNESIKQKPPFFFSKSTPAEVKNHIKSALDVPVILQYEKYLGLPSLVGKNKKVSFNYIKERVWKKIQGWKEKLLSQASREILINSSSNPNLHNELL